MKLLLTYVVVKVEDDVEKPKKVKSKTSMNFDLITKEIVVFISKKCINFTKKKNLIVLYCSERKPSSDEKTDAPKPKKDGKKEKKNAKAVRFSSSLFLLLLLCCNDQDVLSNTG
jgi:hypothetical protein